MTDTDDKGGLTGKARAHWVNIAEGVHDKVGAAIDARKTTHLATILDRFEAELSPVLATFYAEHSANGALPDEVRGLLAKITDPEHFTESLLIGVAVGATIYPILGSLIAPTTQDIANEVWSHNPVVPLTGAELATGVLKGVLTEDHATTQAALVGLNADRFGNLVQIAGQSIGPMDALLLWRRKQIDDDELLDVLRYSNLNPKFFDMVKLLQYAPPGQGAVIAGALKQHLSEDDARTKLAEAGTNPDNYDWLLASAGRPPGVEMVVQLWNHELATEADVERTIAQSDINPAFTELVKLTRLYFVPPRSVVPMLRAGAITPAEADRKLAQHGVQPDDRAAFIAEATHSAAHMVSAKDATASQVTRAYEQELITETEARTKLAALKYVPDAIDLLIELTDNTRIEREQNLAISAMRSKYVSHGIDRQDVQANLATIGVPTAAVTRMLTLWTLERNANVHKLTPAGIMKAYRMGFVQPIEVKNRFLALGIVNDDIYIHVADAYTLKEADEASAAIVLILGA